MAKAVNTKGKHQDQMVQTLVRGSLVELRRRCGKPNCRCRKGKPHATWALCPGRRSITRIYPLAEPAGKRAHDAYHRFFRAGAWCMAQLWRRLAVLLVEALYPTGLIPLAVDDTAFHKTGRKIQGDSWWRDAVRSTGGKVVHCFGLNLVVITLLVQPPWGGEPLGLPINLRLHRKGGRNCFVAVPSQDCIDFSDIESKLEGVRRFGEGLKTRESLARIDRLLEKHCS